MLPVTTAQFWKERLDRAKKNGQLHYSVYLANPTLWQKIYDAHVEILKKEVKETDNVLDAGCGYGRLSPLFEKYVGVDLSPDLLKEAKKLYPNKDFREENIKNLPFKDKEFDVAVCTSIKAMIIDNVGESEWELMAEELKRVAHKVIILEYGDTIKGNPENYEIL